MNFRTFWGIRPALDKAPFLSCSALMLLCLMFYPQVMFANFADLSLVSDQNFGAWEDAGSLSLSMQFCAASAKSPGLGIQAYPYNLKLDSLASNADFFLYKDGNATNSIGSRIALSVSHRSKSINSYAGLNQGVYDTRRHAGDNRGCPSTGTNAEIRLDLDGGQLAQLESGQYSGQFRLTLLGGRNTLTEAFADFQVSLEIVGTTSGVRISGLDDLQLGQHSGLGDIQVSEHFCVFSGSGNYSLSVSSGNQSADGSFAFAGSNTGDRIPFTLAFDDVGYGAALSPVGTTPLIGTGDSTLQDCGGSNNASLTVTVLEQDLQKAASGNYSDTLLLLVQPE